jgi:phospholipase/carboxylesterase
MSTNDPHRGQPVLTAGAPLQGARGAVILIHGRGGSAEDIMGLARPLHHAEVAYLAPQAAEHTWYPYSFLSPIEQNEPWLSSAIGKIKATVESVIQAGISKERIFLCGFSQGACLSSEFIARNPAEYGGLLAFTGGLAGPLGSDLRHTGNLANMPAFFGSGDPDPHVPWQRVEETAEVFRQMGADVTARRFPGLPHVISEDHIEYGRRIFESRLGD